MDLPFFTPAFRSIRLYFIEPRAMLKMNRMIGSGKDVAVQSLGSVFDILRVR